MQIWHKTDLQALYLSGTYCHRTGTRPPSCTKPRKPTKHQYSEIRYQDPYFLNNVIFPHQQFDNHILIDFSIGFLESDCIVTTKVLNLSVT